MSYNPAYEASKNLPVDRIAERLEDFVAAGQDLSSRRFSRSPPPVPSGASTEWEESEPPSPAAQLHDQESRELLNSIPAAQFQIQVRDELDRIHAAIDKGLVQQSSLPDLQEAAEANITYRWIEQGIWDKRWGSQPGEMWTHELLDSLSPAEASSSVSDGETSKSGIKRKRQLPYLEEKDEETVPCAIDFRNRQMSRPCYQFLYQFCQQREWIKMGLSGQYDDQHAKLDSQAYEIVKSRWIRDGLWDEDWTCIPGIWWRHERPPKYPAPYEEYRRAAARKAAKVEQAERPPRWYFMAPLEAPTIIIRPFNSSKSPKIISNPVKFDALNSGSRVKSSQRDRSAISRKRGEKTIPASASESTAQTKPNPTDREHYGRRKRAAVGKANVLVLDPTQTKPRKNARHRTEPRPGKGSSTAIHEKNPPPTPAANKKVMSSGTTTARPRRAAAAKAMQNLMKTARK